MEATRNKGIPALVYKFDRRPIKVRVPLGAINPNLHLDSPFTADLLWDDFIFWASHGASTLLGERSGVSSYLKTVDASHSPPWALYRTLAVQVVNKLHTNC